MKLLVVKYKQFKHAQREKKPTACLTKGSYAGCHTRWHGLESHLFRRPFHLLSNQFTCIAMAG